MRIVITGGAGFLGRRLAREVLARGRLTDASGATQPVTAYTDDVGRYRFPAVPPGIYKLAVALDGFATYL